MTIDSDQLSSLLTNKFEGKYFGLNYFSLPDMQNICYLLHVFRYQKVLQDKISKGVKNICLINRIM